MKASSSIGQEMGAKAEWRYRGWAGTAEKCVTLKTEMGDVMLHNGGQRIMEEWFHMKFNDDLSDIRREEHGYYKYYVHNFVTSFFSKDKVAGKKILDFGCGPGFYSAILARLGAHVVGIEKSKFLIDKANEHKAELKLENVEFCHTDFIDYSSVCRPRMFDYILAIDTIVSFDYDRKTHNHSEVVRAFRGVERLLKTDGKFFIIESHPLFGQIVPKEKGADNEGCLYNSAYSYKIDYKVKESSPHHWFTLDEMTRATCDSGLAILRIYEPDPSIDLRREDSLRYSFRLKYPGMIVYEIVKTCQR